MVPGPMGPWGSDGLEGLVIQGDGENFIVLDPGGARNPRRLGTFIRTAELPIRGFQIDLEGSTAAGPPSWFLA
jgi:hypothetical protein